MTEKSAQIGMELKNKIYFNSVYVCGYEHVSVGTSVDQWCQIYVELEGQTFVSHPIWMLGSELGSSG